MSEGLQLPGDVSVRYALLDCSGEALQDPDQLAQRLNKQGVTSHRLLPDGFWLSVLTDCDSVVVRAFPQQSLAIVQCWLSDASRATDGIMRSLKEVLAPNGVIEEETPAVPRLQETVLPGHQYTIAMDEVLAHQQGAMQSLSLVNTPAFGKTLVLDGFFQVSERGDEYYHEPLVHVPMLSHPFPRRVAICGGGDGGAARDVLRHPSVEQCTIVEIDRDVVEFSKTHLQQVDQGALSDRRVNVVIADAAEWIAQTEEMFDVIIMDTTDPQGCGEVLFTQSFYVDVHARLNEGGMASLHVTAPLCFPDDSRKASGNVRSVFDSVYPYSQFIPLYSTLIGFMLVGRNEMNRIPGESAMKRASERGIQNLNVLNEHTWDGLFAVEPAVEEILAG